MAVSVWSPRISVTLFKVIQRTDGVSARYAGAARQVDLTPYLGDAGAVRTTKSLDNPCGGFAITFPDMPIATLRDSAYGLVEPMDLIEIRASPDGSVHVDGKLPLLMRGFVSNVSRDEAMTDSGPMRTVTVSGQDAGKLWMIHQVFWELALQTDKPMLTIFELQAALGLDATDSTLFAVSDYMTLIVNKVMNPKIATLAQISSQLIRPFTIRASVKDGQVMAKTAGAMTEGPLWNTLETFADRPWNELFVLDEEAGPVIIFRPAPYYDLNGSLIMHGAEAPPQIEVSGQQIVSVSMARSDARVANFFWSPPGATTLITSGIANAQSISAGASPRDLTYGNNRPDLYGEKKMAATTSLVADGIANLPDLLPPGDQAATDGRVIEWPNIRAEQLRYMNRDNSVLEEGGITLHGGADFVVGSYLKVTRGALSWTAYMVGVSHQLGPYMPWTSSVSLTRGTSFIERSKLAGSPFWAEGRPGPYSLGAP